MAQRSDLPPGTMPAPALHARRARRQSLAPANDNDARRDPAQLRAALLHFARYGVGAAAIAAGYAECAAKAGDRLRFAHWRAICTLLDRRRGDCITTPAGW